MLLMLHNMWCHSGGGVDEGTQSKVTAALSSNGKITDIVPWGSLVVRIFETPPHILVYTELPTRTQTGIWLSSYTYHTILHSAVNVTVLYIFCDHAISINVDTNFSTTFLFAIVQPRPRATVRSISSIAYHLHAHPCPCKSMIDLATRLRTSVWLRTSILRTSVALTL